MLKKLGILLCLGVFFSAFALAQDKTESTSVQNAKAWNTVCPVDGSPVNPDIITLKYDGKQYGFCSASCAKVFSESPETYIGNLNEDGTKFIGKTEGEDSGGAN